MKKGPILSEVEGFSLIEVLIFVTIFSLFFIIAIASLTSSLRDMKINEHKILAVKYAEELIEWIKAEKEIDWNQFISQRMNKYCFNNQLSDNWPTIGECASYNGISGVSPLIFKREAVLTYDDSHYQVDVTVTVSWVDLEKTYSIPLNSTMTLWEQ
jgi:type II secretory pathway pseudopilin PulG